MIAIVHATVYLYVIIGCIDVSIASQVYNDLMVSLDYMVLSTDLHLLYLVVPHEMIDAIVPNWPVYFEMVCTCTCQYFTCT